MTRILISLLNKVNGNTVLIQTRLWKLLFIH